MNSTRKFYLKLFALLFILSLIQWRMGVAAVLAKPLHWATLATLIVAIVYPLGRPVHWLWEKYVSLTTEGMRFFMGVGIVCAGIATYKSEYQADAAWTAWLIGGGSSYLLGLIRPLADLVYKGWMALAHGIQFVVSRVILTTIYVIAVIPVGLFARLTGKHFLEKSLDPEATSYWANKEPADPANLKKYHRHF